MPSKIPPVVTYIEAIGRRKRAVARVRFMAGSGRFFVNEKPLQEFFPEARLRERAQTPLKTMGVEEKTIDLSIHVQGGGRVGQAEAIRLGLSRCLLKENPERRLALRAAGLLTRDSRKKERKKPGLLGARRAPQWSKR